MPSCQQQMFLLTEQQHLKVALKFNSNKEAMARFN